MNNNYNISQFNKDLDSLHIKLTPEQIEQFLTYYELLVEWNQKMNLTAITEYDEVMKKHFIDSLSLVKAVDFLNEGMDCEKNVIDVGTGAGFPGLALKIAFPKLQVTLLDSLNKRILFLEEVIQKLGLQGVVALHGRAEDFAAASALKSSTLKGTKAKGINTKKNSKCETGFGKSQEENMYREQYDLCVSRAVANLSTLSEYCLPFVKVGGSFISYKSEKVSEEAEAAGHAISVLGGKVEKQVEFYLPDSDIYRNLFVINKVKETPKKYPRKAGLPGKEPIQ